MAFLGNKNGIEIAISTLIIMILSIAVLIGLFFLFKNNFSIFKSETGSFLETSEGAATKQACEIACRAESKLNYCCDKHKVKKEEIKCTDERLELMCRLNCEGFNCEGVS